MTFHLTGLVKKSGSSFGSTKTIYDFLIGFWDCPGIVIFFYFSFFSVSVLLLVIVLSVLLLLVIVLPVLLRFADSIYSFVIFKLFLYKKKVPSWKTSTISIYYVCFITCQTLWYIWSEFICYFASNVVNGQKKKRSNDDLKNIHLKLKIE
jgi:hypothetical protein